MKQLSSDDFPILSEIVSWGLVKAKLTLDTKVDEALVSNISIVPNIGERYVIIQLKSGLWELPGGTREPGEHFMDTIRRETLEELGAELLSYRIMGQFHCESSAEKPYRPHIPHPRFVRLVGFGEVELTRLPLNPPDGEQVTVVDTVSIDEAMRRFEQQGRYDLAEIYKLAHWMRRCNG